MSLKRCTIHALLSLLIGMILGSCSSADPIPATLVYGLTLAPSGLDPHLHASAELGIPLSSVYDMLIFRDDVTGQYVPGLAERWTISPDGREYTFYLRKDVIFHDGTPFNARAVQANIEYVLDPENHSQKALSMLGPVSSIRVEDEFQVVFELDDAYTPLLDSLSQVYLGMASPQALERWGPAEYQFHQVGTGPYQFVEYIPNDHLLLRRNPDYAWAPEIYDHQVASIEFINFLFFEMDATRAIALESRQVDIMGEIPFREAERLSSGDGFTLYPIAIPGQPMQFYFNLNREPTQDRLVREALSLGLDRAQLVRTVFGKRSPLARGPLSGVVFGDLLVDAPAEYDPETAANLLDQAGWVDDDGDGFREKDGQPLALTIIAPTWGGNTEAAQLMEVAWEALGARVDIVTAQGFGPLRELQSTGNYSVIGINFFGTDADLLRPSYRSDGFFNWSGIADIVLDRLLDSAATVIDGQSERDTQYREAIARIMDAYAVLPLRDYLNLVVARSNVKGLRFSIQGWFPYLIDLELSS